MYFFNQVWSAVFDHFACYPVISWTGKKHGFRRLSSAADHNLQIADVRGRQCWWLTGRDRSSIQNAPRAICLPGSGQKEGNIRENLSPVSIVDLQDRNDCSVSARSWLIVCRRSGLKAWGLGLVAGCSLTTKLAVAEVFLSFSTSGEGSATQVFPFSVECWMLLCCDVLDPYYNVPLEKVRTILTQNKNYVKQLCCWTSSFIVSSF